jgi:hypothetical protein
MKVMKWLRRLFQRRTRFVFLAPGSGCVYTVDSKGDIWYWAQFGTDDDYGWRWRRHSREGLPDEPDRG